RGQSGVFTGIPIMAVKFDGNIILEANFRTTTESYTTNRVTDKLIPIHGGTFCCHSGSAADTQSEADVVAYQLGWHSVELTEPPLVHTAASLLKEMCYRYRKDLMAGIITEGWDSQEGRQVSSAFTIGDSGSSYICGYVEATYQEGVTKKECLQSTANTLSLAMKQDGSSSSVIHLAATAESEIEWKNRFLDEIKVFTEKETKNKP
uniref:proteasome endopeptidase complex n=1 Tax=Capra hircus TaxID=9925 RepID=A0A8C2XVJ4_CAPHI